jgi:hypothetical protein
MVLWHSMHAWVASLTLTSAAGAHWGKTRRLTAANQKRVLFITNSFSSGPVGVYKVVYQGVEKPRIRP